MRQPEVGQQRKSMGRRRFDRVLIVFLIRLRLLFHLRRTQRITTADLQIAKLWDGRIFALYCGLYIVNFALCVAGRSFHVAQH